VADDNPRGGLTFAQFAESMQQVEEHANDLPVVHWRGLDSQEVATYEPYVSIRRPTRCGLTHITALLAGRPELVNCLLCRELMADDEAGDANG
jgi:hypothetical protein